MAWCFFLSLFPSLSFVHNIQFSYIKEEKKLVLKEYVY